MLRLFCKLTDLLRLTLQLRAFLYLRQLQDYGT